MIIDTHAHYDDEQFDEDREEILGKMQDAGIGMIMDAGSTILSWDKIVKLTEEYPFVYGAIGVHPDEVGNLDETQFARMERLLDKEKIKAVDRTIHARMREYLYELKHNDALVTSIIPLGDGVALSVKKEVGTDIAQ